MKNRRREDQAMSEKTNAPKKKIEAAPAPGGRHRGAASMSQIKDSMGSLK